MNQKIHNGLKMPLEVPGGAAPDAASGEGNDGGERAKRMSVLAQADGTSLRRVWSTLGVDPAFETVRGPESGLVALRGRIGGGGAPFNFGEATASRATVRLADGRIGHAVTLGRDHVKAQLGAIIDALALDETMAQRIESDIIAPLRAEQVKRDKERREQTEATRVDFFTMVRGED